MTDKYSMHFGSMKENDDIILVEIPISRTNVIEAEQLDELRRKAPLFFTCQHFIVAEDNVRIYYRRDKDFISLQRFSWGNHELTNIIANNLLKVDKLIGTQFNTVLDPGNIFVNHTGDVKLAHRGIRSVLPPKEFTINELLKQLKVILIYLYTEMDFSEINGNMLTLATESSLINDIHLAASIEDLRKIIQNQLDFPIEAEKEQQNKPDIQKKGLSVLASLLIGLLIGMILIYVAQVMPITETATKMKTTFHSEQKILEENISELESDLHHYENINSGLYAALKGKTETAISMLEAAGSLDENAEQTLFEQYLMLNTIKSLEKAASLNQKYQVKTVEKLLALNNKEANQIILSMKSTDPKVMIEQAWLQNDYDQVIKLFKGIPVNERAKLLAAKSYLELEQTAESFKLSQELGNHAIQISSLEKERTLIEADEKLEDDEKEEMIKEINDQIEALKKQ